VKENLAGRGIYFTVNITTVGLNKKPTKEEIVAARFSHCDIDPPKGGGAFDRSAIMSRLMQGTPPSLVIDSGNGLQPLWRLNHAPTDYGPVEDINRSIADSLGGDNCHNIDRLLRVPGTVNYPSATKRKAGRVAVMTGLAHVGSTDAIFGLAELAQAFPPRTDGKPKEEPHEEFKGDIKLLMPDDLRLSQLSPIRSVIEHPAGSDRSADGLRAAGDMLRAGFTKEQVLGVLLNPANRASAHYMDQKDPRRAALRTIAYADRDKPSPEGEQRAEGRAPANDIVTEDSAAVLFVEQYGNDLRFCHSTGAWFRWQLTSWSQDRTGIAFQWARELNRRLAENQDERKRYITHKTAFASGVERFAKVDPQIAVTIDYWDRDPWLLGTPGGTVDLRTGELRDSDRSDGITKTAMVAPDGGGCPQWLRFLAEATGNDQALVRFLQQWCGYCLTGVTREHALVFVYGPGGNGKTVFLNVVTTILRDYATTAAMDTFTASHSDRHPTDLAMLRGARLVTASETEEGRAWAEAKIKQMTGGDRISARFMRQDFFEFTPQFKLTIVGNHKPVLRNVDEAARRRFNIVPFTRKPANPDTQLEHKLLAEAPGILGWMIAGCLDWQTNGLCRPKVVVDATDAYFADQDLVGQWLEERCERRVSSPLIWDLSANLFESWSTFAHKAGEDPGKQKAFGQALQKRGFEPHRATGGGRGFKHIRVLPAGSWSDA
jgi:putative DNA primase/helicase